MLSILLASLVSVTPTISKPGHESVVTEARSAIRGAASSGTTVEVSTWHFDQGTPRAENVETTADASGKYVTEPVPLGMGLNVIRVTCDEKSAWCILNRCETFSQSKRKLVIHIDWEADSFSRLRQIAEKTISVSALPTGERDQFVEAVVQEVTNRVGKLFHSAGVNPDIYVTGAEEQITLHSSFGEPRVVDSVPPDDVHSVRIMRKRHPKGIFGWTPHHIVDNVKHVDFGDTHYPDYCEVYLGQIQQSIDQDPESWPMNMGEPGERRLREKQVAKVIAHVCSHELGHSLGLVGYRDGHGGEWMKGDTGGHNSVHIKSLLRQIHIHAPDALTCERYSSGYFVMDPGQDCSNERRVGGGSPNPDFCPLSPNAEVSWREWVRFSKLNANYLAHLFE